MNSFQKNKTFATLLAFLVGAIGAHRFYLYGRKDLGAWLHLASLPVCGAIMTLWPNLPFFFAIMPLTLSALIALIEGLVLGLTPDEQWDALHNPDTSRPSHSSWLLAILLVLIVGAGATGLIAVIARSFDLLFTGGAYG
ncbi:MAG: TM2 domain-containing protein [Proteobacteria bacterium]|nr:TM2 domain-containing protein [Pseudomonadota bacterium]